MSQLDFNLKTPTPEIKNTLLIPNKFTGSNNSIRPPALGQKLSNLIV